jgi:cell filamentation protein
MFSLLFGWAGRPRTVGIAKGGTPFCPPQNIDAVMDAIFAELEREQWLAGLDLDSFIGRAAYYICELNAVHPFREGNGRAIRFYMDVLSAKARGDIFDWTRSSADEYLQACVEGFRQDYSRMVSVLQQGAS